MMGNHTRQCVHCGRQCADYAGGYGTIEGHPLCHPNAPNRPDCYTLALPGSKEHPLYACPTCTPAAPHA